jgi:hypothetical protein
VYSHEEMQRIHAIGNKPDSSWTLQEKNLIYWWYYHEMDDPTEEALRYLAQILVGTNNSIKWLKFLVQLFPSEENVNLVKKILGADSFDSGSQQRFRKVIRSMLKAQHLSQTHLDLALLYGSKKTKRQVQKIILRRFTYEI